MSFLRSCLRQQTQLDHWGFIFDPHLHPRWLRDSTLAPAAPHWHLGHHHGLAKYLVTLAARPTQDYSEARTWHLPRYPPQIRPARFADRLCFPEAFHWYFRPFFLILHANFRQKLIPTSLTSSLPHYRRQHFQGSDQNLAEKQLVGVAHHLKPPSRGRERSSASQSKHQLTVAVSTLPPTA